MQPTRGNWMQGEGGDFRSAARGRLGRRTVAEFRHHLFGKDAQGLPLGLQLIGRPFDEETLFSLGEVIEQAAGRFTPPRWW